MKTPKFTPGPWRYQEMSDAYTHIARGPNNEFILYGPQSSSAEIEADIRLASAAPDFLEIAKGLVRIDDEHDFPRWEYWMPKLRAAIAKAEGEQR